MMKCFSIVYATLGILWALHSCALAALENRLDSLGSLIRYNPYAEVPQFLVRTHGKPHLGLPSAAGDRLQRVSDACWYLEIANGIALMEPDYQTGEVELKEVIQAGEQWCVSPNGEHLFASRKSKRYQLVYECFDLPSGKSIWTFEKDFFVLNTCFTPDGKEVVVLHKMPAPPRNMRPSSGPMDMESAFAAPPPVSAAVSWYDARSGELTRRVEIPGNSGDSTGSFMAFSGDWLFLARPGNEAAGECFVIKPGAATPEKIAVKAMAKEECPRVEVGGFSGEFVAFYNEFQVTLFRRDSERTLAHVLDLNIEGSPDGFYYKSCVGITPDGENLMISHAWKTIFVPTSGEDNRRECDQGSALADFSQDGRFFLAFDHGGGWMCDVNSWEKVQTFESKLRPLHCCPISEAGFSMSGNYMVTCDKVRLLLWSKDGEQLAELYSSRTDEKQGVNMQSPIILEEQGKIYGADGFNFLEWDLAAIHRRLSRKPDNIPRVTGKVVFRDRKEANPLPEVMKIRIDSKGENIMTATERVVRFRPKASSAPIEVTVPEDEIMVPRVFLPGGNKPTIIIRRDMDAYTLDLTGKQKSSVIRPQTIGIDPTGTHFFSVESSGDECHVWTHSIGNREEAVLVASLPPGVNLTPERAILSPDGKWIIGIPIVVNVGSLLVVIDVTERQLIHSQPFKWAATSVALSEDGKRLLIGGSNRSIYEFDFQRMTRTP